MIEMVLVMVPDPTLAVSPVLYITNIKAGAKFHVILLQIPRASSTMAASTQALVRCTDNLVKAWVTPTPEEVINIWSQHVNQLLRQTDPESLPCKPGGDDCYPRPFPDILTVRNMYVLVNGSCAIH